jgi:LAS superfamily LD-carboxypeptidase LdcB
MIRKIRQKRAKMPPKYPYKKMVLPKELVSMKDVTGKLTPEMLTKSVNGAKFWRWAGIAFNQMFNDAEKAGFKLQNIGDYRSYEQQLAMFKERYSTTDGGRKPQVTRTWDGKTWYLKPKMSPSSSPGKSNHGLGLAIDLNVTNPKILDWLCENAPKYGFYLQSDNPASPEFEAWHWQYVCGDATPEAVKTRFETNEAKKAAKAAKGK